MDLNLSKSQYVRGINCPLSLWYFKNRKDIQRIISEKSQQIMDGGQAVGLLAQELYPAGVLIAESYKQIEEAIKSTKEAVKNGASVLFEATACTKDGNYSRIDIFKKVPNTYEWDMIEVKCSTEVKDYQIDDVAFQRYAFEEAGYKIRKSILMYINADYLRDGALDLKQLFVERDLTEEAKKRKPQVTSNVQNLINIIGEAEPKTQIGPQCTKEFDCDYKHYCWRNLPEYSIFNIGRFMKKWDCYNKGIINIEDIYSHYDLLNPKQMIEVESYRNNEVHIEKDKIREFLDQLEYPLYYLDYETTSNPIPPFDKSSPYQQIPFQFSLHIQKQKDDGELEHIEFLHEDNSDPRLPFIKKLIASCGKSGSIIVYNIAFERSIVNERLIQQFPEYEGEISSINERMIDLLVPFSNRFIYHPEMKGSASIKKVLPAFVPELSYKDLEIQEGGTASQEYLMAISPQTNKEESKKVFENLREYCGLDTMAMVRLVGVLRKLA